MVWIAFAVMTAGAVSSIVWPLLRPRASAGTLTVDVDFYTRQIADLDDDVGRGLLRAEDAAASRAELGRRLLAASERAETARPSGRGRRAVALAAVVLVPAVALGLYVAIGKPTYGDAPLEARAAPTQDIAALVQRVEAHLAAVPDDVRGYELVAPVYMQMGRYDDAAHAYGEVLRLSGDTPERQTAYGQALTMAADGVVTQQARDAFASAAKAQPSLPQARFFLGLAAEQDGDKAGARDIWRTLVAEAPPGAPWIDMVRRRLAAMDGTDASPQGPGAMPSGPMAAGIAALPADQQNAAIRGMVEGLAARLAAKGDDPDGWLRLVRAYKVLGETEKAGKALVDARRQMGGNAEALGRLDGLARELGLGG